MQAECLFYMPDESTSRSGQRQFGPGLSSLVCDGQVGALLDLPECFGSILSLHRDMKQIFINSLLFHVVASN